MLDKIKWLGHDSFRIEGEKTIYIDPFQITGGPPADIILVSHDHRDHCSPEDIKKVQKADTIIITTSAAAANLQGDVRAVTPGDSLMVAGIQIETVPAYNVNKFRSPGVPFHPKESQMLGFIIAIDGERIYHAGDTDVIPEMTDIKADIAMLPVSGQYAMTPEEAVEAARIINPKVAVPMHYGAIVGSQENAEKFKSLATVKVEILEKSS